MIKDDYLKLKEILSIAWRITKHYYALLIAFSIILFCISTFSNLLSIYLKDKLSVAVNSLLGILFLFTYIIVNLGIIKAIIWILDKDNENFEFQQIQPNIAQVGNYILSTISYGALFVLLGYNIVDMATPIIRIIAGRHRDFSFVLATLFISPLLWIFLKAYFYQFFILDKDMGAFESIVASLKATRNKVFRIFGLLSIFVVIYILTYWFDKNHFIAMGILFRALNFFLIFPFTTVALVVMYRDLTQKSET